MKRPEGCAMMCQIIIQLLCTDNCVFKAYFCEANENVSHPRFKVKEPLGKKLGLQVSSKQGLPVCLWDVQTILSAVVHFIAQHIYIYTLGYLFTLEKAIVSTGLYLQHRELRKPYFTSSVSRTSVTMLVIAILMGRCPKIRGGEHEEHVLLYMRHDKLFACKFMASKTSNNFVDSHRRRINNDLFPSLGCGCSVCLHKPGNRLCPTLAFVRNDVLPDSGGGHEAAHPKIYRAARQLSTLDRKTMGLQDCCVPQVWEAAP